MKSALGTARNPREVELKFQLPEGSRAILEAFPALKAATAQHNDLVSTYFDTPDRELDRSGLTLRVRRNGEVRTQTVKSRSDGHGMAASRGEWEWPVSQDTPELAWLSKTPSLAAIAITIKGRLQPAFITNIHRTTRLLRLEDDTTVELAFDEGEIEAGLAHEPVSELEIELKSGDVGPLYRLASALLSTAPLWLMSESKASRGWRLRTGQNEGAQLARPLKLKWKLSLDEGFRQIFGATLGHLMANIGPTLRGDPEGLHQARLAIREARAALQLFDQYLDIESAERFKARLRTYGEILGAARDWDVFCLETLPAAMPDLSSERLEDLNAAAEVERQLAHEAVAAAVRSREFSELVLGLESWADIGAIKPSRHGAGVARQHLSTLAPSLLDRSARKVRRRGRHIGRLSEAERHSLRKSLKKLSFDVEALARFYGSKPAKRYQGRCEALGKILGAANDTVVTNQLAHKLATAERPELSKPARALERWNNLRGRKVLNGLKASMGNWRMASAFWS
jgi:inorganic triphosphatase YgiF